VNWQASLGQYSNRGVSSALETRILLWGSIAKLPPVDDTHYSTYSDGVHIKAFDLLQFV